MAGPVRPRTAGVNHAIKQRTKSVLRMLASGSGLIGRIEEAEKRADASQASQVLLALHYRELVEQGRPLPSFNDVEFSVHSQNGEDGLLLFLFSILGTCTTKCVELCSGDGIECNTANLIANHGWRGLLVDGNASNIVSARNFYGRSRKTAWYPPDIVESWVTAENANGLIVDHGYDGEIDLLALDMDGIDYWIWNALEAPKPRVVIAEFNWTWGPDESRTVPYDPSFSVPNPGWSSDGSHIYFGASLTAFTKLARAKGYRLVGCQRWGFNAFFVQDGVGEDLLPEVSPAQCYETPSLRARWSPQFFDLLSTQEWVIV